MRRGWGETGREGSTNVHAPCLGASLALQHPRLLPQATPPGYSPICWATLSSQSPPWLQEPSFPVCLPWPEPFGLPHHDKVTGPGFPWAWEWGKGGVYKPGLGEGGVPALPALQ